MGDVHDMDTPLTLPSGKAVWPAMISFVDIATQRMRSTIVICEKMSAVRVTDMIQAYLAMVSDPAWGLPRTLYLDNGKENVFAPFMADAVKLAWQDEDGSEHRTLVKATAHNPQAKAHVEARFALFENHYLKFLQGWAGDNRHDPKVPALGKRHAPHSAGVEAYFTDFYDFENACGATPAPRRTTH